MDFPMEIRTNILRKQRAGGIDVRAETSRSGSLMKSVLCNFFRY